MYSVFVQLYEVEQFYNVDVSAQLFFIVNQMLHDGDDVNHIR